MFSQQYRGTPYGQPLEPAPDHEPGRRAWLGRRPALLALASVVAVAGIFAWTAFGGRLPTIPGFGPSPKPNSAIAQRFLKLASDDALTFHVVYRATVKAGAAAASLSGQGDVAGPDFAGSVRSVRGATRSALDVIVKGGNVYARRAGAAWRTAGAEVVGPSPNPFEKLAPQTPLQDMGQVTRRRAKLRHLRSTEWLGGDPARFLPGGTSAPRVEKATTTVYVTSAGVPVELVLTATLSADLAGKRQQVTVSASYTFTRVGKAVRITAPRVR